MTSANGGGFFFSPPAPARPSSSASAATTAKPSRNRRVRIVCPPMQDEVAVSRNALLHLLPRRCSAGCPHCGPGGMRLEQIGYLDASPFCTFVQILKKCLC